MRGRVVGGGAGSRPVSGSAPIRPRSRRPAGSHAADQARRWHAVISRPVATWISWATADRQCRTNRAHPCALGRAGARSAKSASNLATITVVASIDTESAHALATSAASTTANAPAPLNPTPHPHQPHHPHRPRPQQLATTPAAPSPQPQPTQRRARERAGLRRAGMRPTPVRARVEPARTRRARASTALVHAGCGRLGCAQVGADQILRRRVRGVDQMRWRDLSRDQRSSRARAAQDRRPSWSHVPWAVSSLSNRFEPVWQCHDKPPTRPPRESPPRESPTQRISGTDGGTDLLTALAGGWASGTPAKGTRARSDFGLGQG
jgi:hypothetical protein